MCEPAICVRSLFRFAVFWLTVLCFASATAGTMRLQGNWYPPDSCQAESPNLAAGSRPVSVLERTHGHYCWYGQLTLTAPEDLVIDFSNTTVIGRFQHTVYDASGHVAAAASGGIMSHKPDPFLLRHGRVFHLPAGQYTLITRLESPFLLAQPEPAVAPLDDYLQALKMGDAITLVCLGILIGLMFYYLVLASLRRNLTDLLYSLFLLGNLLYNGTALLVFPELLHIHWFYLISFPILLSNIAYILFVLQLLNIRKANHPWLYRTGLFLIGTLSMFALCGFIFPHESLELDRAGVSIFLSFGLISGAIRTWQGHHSAPAYLNAVILFFIMGIVSISLGKLADSQMINIEHLGLIAVTIEALLLALVVARQFSQLRAQFEHAWTHAMHDSLTGLKNRRGFLESGVAETERSRQNNQSMSIIFLDLDNFKQLNDTYGHDAGDAALRATAKALRNNLRANDLLARLGGDEFAILLPEIDHIAAVETGRKVFLAVNTALLDFPPVTASMGVIRFERTTRSFAAMMKIADDLMYEVKKNGKNNMSYRQFDD